MVGDAGLEAAYVRLAAAEMRDAADRIGTQAHDAVEGEQPLVPALDPVRLPPPGVGREHHRSYHRVEPWGVSPAGGQRNPHHLELWSIRTTSPGSACRRDAFLEKITLPSTATSKTPPEEGINRTSASGNDCFSSAARLAALGW